VLQLGPQSERLWVHPSVRVSALPSVLLWALHLVHQ
jgi:hypothetical protein